MVFQGGTYSNYLILFLNQLSLFKKDVKKLPLKVLNREYILRTKVARPVRSSSILPQRLYALIGQSEFRMAGAFSEDQTFFL